jgi:hypothetical protein
VNAVLWQCRTNNYLRILRESLQVGADCPYQSPRSSQQWAERPSISRSCLPTNSSHSAIINTSTGRTSSIPRRPAHAKLEITTTRQLADHPSSDIRSETASLASPSSARDIPLPLLLGKKVPSCKVATGRDKRGRDVYILDEANTIVRSAAIIQFSGVRYLASQSLVTAMEKSRRASGGSQENLPFWKAQLPSRLRHLTPQKVT